MDPGSCVRIHEVEIFPLLGFRRDGSAFQMKVLLIAAVSYRL